MKTTPVRRLWRAIPALLLVLIPLRIAGQSAQPVQQPATATSWADDPRSWSTRSWRHGTST
jgi:hypothetical protein